MDDPDKLKEMVRQFYIDLYTREARPRDLGVLTFKSFRYLLDKSISNRRGSKESSLRDEGWKGLGPEWSPPSFFQKHREVVG